MTHYTLMDLELAKANQRHEDSRYERYQGNNPNKYVADCRRAAKAVATIERGLKLQGDLPWTQEELLERALDAAYPRARSKDVVEHEGKRYERRFRPLEKSRTGAVKSWQGYWVELS